MGWADVAAFEQGLRKEAEADNARLREALALIAASYNSTAQRMIASKAIEQ